MRFEILIGPQDGMLIQVDGNQALIGRQVSDGGIRITWDPYVSKKHVSVEREGRGFRIVDTGNDGKGSTHGTVLYDPSLHEKGHFRGQAMSLEMGDIFMLGRTFVKFLGD